MANRITIWKQAGILVLLDVPDTYKHALVFMTGLERAARLQYPSNATFSVRRETPSSCHEPVIVFQYVGGRMAEVRKTESKVCAIGPALTS
jgi:hypothetical protein